MRIKLFWLSYGRWKKMHAQYHSLWESDEIFWNLSYYCWQVCLDARKHLDMFSLAKVSLAIEFNKISAYLWCTDNMSETSALNNLRPFQYLTNIGPDTSKAWGVSALSLRGISTLLHSKQSQSNLTLLSSAFTWRFQAPILIIYQLDILTFMQFFKKSHFLPMSLPFLKGPS